MSECLTPIDQSDQEQRAGDTLMHRKLKGNKNVRCNCRFVTFCEWLKTFAVAKCFFNPLMLTEAKTACL